MTSVRVVTYDSALDRLQRTVDRKAVHPVTDAVADDMRHYVPVLSGALHGTIRAVHLEGEGRVYFGNVSGGVGYHLFQEFGTSIMAAQPYARPALYKERSIG